MKKINLILILFIPLIFMGCNDDSKKKKVSSENDIQLEVTLERDMTSSHPLDVIFKLTNLSDETVYYNTHYAPTRLGDLHTSGSFTINEDGSTLEYGGIFALYPAFFFDFLAPGETFSTNISLDKSYTIQKGTHNYNITFSNTILAKYDNKPELLDDNYLPDYPNALTENNHTSKPINIKSNTLEFEATINEIRNFN